MFDKLIDTTQKLAQQNRWTHTVLINPVNKATSIKFTISGYNYDVDLPFTEIENTTSLESLILARLVTLVTTRLAP